MLVKRNLKKFILNLIVHCLMMTLFFSCVESQESGKSGRTGISRIRTSLTPTPTPTPEKPTRPGANGTSAAVLIQNDYCACLKGKPDILSDCASFCSTRTSDTEPWLYLNVKLTADIELSSLKDLNGWCTKEIQDGNTNPSCEMIFDDQLTSPIKVPITPDIGSKKLRIPIKDLTYNRRYVAYIRETKSLATSDKIQFQRVEQQTTTPVQGLLKTTPISLFSCIWRIGSTGTFNTYDNAFRRHFYYVDKNYPPSLPTTDFLFCHDVIQFGSTDSPLFPRLELRENEIKLWSEVDSRFTDQVDENGNSTANQQPDINDTIKSELKKQNITSSGSYFQQLPWIAYPGVSNAPRLGFFLTAFVDTYSGRATCPTQAEYNSNSPLYNLLRDYIGVDTEGFWFALKEPECYKDSSGKNQPVPTDIMIMREGTLKKIWFYMKNGTTPTEPTESVLHSNTAIYFYWPMDEVNPYIKKSTQKIYKLVYPDELNSDVAATLCGGTGSSGSSNTGGTAPSLPVFRSSDKRIGCLPAIQE